MAQLLRDAIDRSASQNEIITVEFAGDESDLCIALGGLYDGEIGSMRENDGTIDVWGFTAEMAEGTMAWRLKVALTD